MTSSRISLLAGILLVSAAAFADCPDGGRQTTTSEQQFYVEATTSIKTAIPPAPAGWTLRDRNAATIIAPTSLCKGSPLVPGYFITYLWADQQKRNELRIRERDVRVRALGLLSPEEQKQVDDLSRQGRNFERQAQAVIRTNPDEAARLRAQARPFAEQANAIRKAHQEKVFPEMEAIRKEEADAYIEPEVNVSISLSKEASVASKAERTQIAGIPSTFQDKDLVMSFGHDDAGRTLWVKISGSRPAVEAIANLYASSNLVSWAGKKQ